MTAVEAAYRRLLATGELRPDVDQERVVAHLDRLAQGLAAPPPGRWRRWLGRGGRPLRGVYLWGGVGRGKSMLMDLFFAHAPEPRRLRRHFHEFMLETHARIHAHRQVDPGDPLPAVARAWGAEARLLCLDEMQVISVADAMILGRLFTALVDGGTVVVTTSNRPPTELYQGGINRELFLPFVDLLTDRFDVLRLDGPVDYRRERMGGLPVYYVPNGEETTKALSQLFFRLTDFPPEDRERVPRARLRLPSGRTLEVPKSLKGVAVFSFKRLLAAPTGPEEYLAIARTYHTVFLVGVPVMGPEHRNEAARFTAFVDALYDWRVKLVIGADAPPQGLYPAGDGSFEFQRTVSRLIEMQSEAYLAAGHGARG
ncbi:MAG: cell division protein ZapE [Sphingomonadaceae bacterium]|uniref:cell division protein ZapE n=1 Tax=Thermaurantiacus sp. TaxID=2820283 RepID=UPI00298F199B|nr:cell division protein ZapE [Thermaurantiacus sp.]MCS6985950.1 cell division protein ZapE [Sphingomonadaceae bacterium]MDW8414834.1 cell division protein ZapE [Thermaurantiacus sp.]